MSFVKIFGNFKNIICYTIIVSVVFVSVIYVNGEEKHPDIHAQNGAILIACDTGAVFYEQDADKIAPMASTTKIMSTMLALESKNLDEIFVVDSNAIKVEGSSMGLREGDMVTLRDLCYGMMLPSGNDAANAAAVRVSGSIDKFVKKMNSKAKEIGMKNTHFCTPSGLDTADPNEHHSTARDMAVLVKKAMENPDFCDICSQYSKQLCYGNPPYNRTLYNHNKLLKSYEGACGVKTGFTKKAGRCLVSAAQKDGVKLIAVVLKDYADWNDSKALFDYGFSKMSLVNLPNDFSDISLTAVGSQDEKFGVKSDVPPKTSITNDDINKVKITIKTDPFYYAPIKEGSNVGEAVYSIDNNILCKVNLYADKNIE